MSHTALDERIASLRESVARLSRIERRLADLAVRSDELDLEVERLRETMYAEQRDVERLEGRTLARLLSYLTGKSDERLDRERAEAASAAAKYDAKKAESKAISDRIFELRTERSRLDGCEARLNELEAQKKAQLKESGGEVSEKLTELDAKHHSLGEQLREIDEAVKVGRAAITAADAALVELDGAAGWATFDILGGGLISDLAKHEKIDAAQSHIEHLNNCIELYKTELGDVDMSFDGRVVSDGMKFADFFFDGLVSDFLVHDKLEKSTERLRGIRDKLSASVGRLHTRRELAETERSAVKREIEKLI